MPADLIRAGREILRRYPEARLMKNRVGNISIMVEGEYVGYVELYNGLVTWIEKEET